jgi:hypothetical protein
MLPELSLFDLLFCYALTFGLMNKVTFIYNRFTIIDKLLSCSYCTGFHSGWMLYFFKGMSLEKFYDVKLLIYYAMVSASFCYFIDVVLVKIEE